VNKKSVRVHIVGEEYAIRTERSPEVTRAVAEYVDRTIRGILEGGSVIETQKAAILAAMKITDELFQTREKSAELSEAITALSTDVRRMLPPAKREVST
jgi:cell division protein ZapA